MGSINEINTDHIGRLDEHQLVEVLRKLLQAESHKNNLQAKIDVPENITTHDGGEDGRISWENGPETTEFLTSRISGFQCKATKMGPRDCYNEVLLKQKSDEPKKLKPKIKELLDKGGSYNLFTSQELTPKLINDRLKEIRKAFKEAGYVAHDTVVVNFFDANRISQWVNRYISTVTLVQAFADISRPQGFKTWEQWEVSMEGSEIPYKTNEIIDLNIKQIREEIKSKNVIRVLGHSGLGKTRLVLETFREMHDNPEVKGLQSQVVYYNMGMGDLKDLATYIISHMENQSGIIVVDNCDANDHAGIQSLVAKGGNFKIITIDFSTRSEEASTILLDRKYQMDIVEQIIQERFGNDLPDSDKKYLAELSEGYPQMAILFSNSIKNKGFVNLSKELRPEFIKRLIFERDTEREFEYPVIRACSVVSNFGFVDENFGLIRKDIEEELSKQSDFVRVEICGLVNGKEVSKREFDEICRKFIKKNILEKRGTYLMVRPTPLAINLASEWWSDIPKSEAVNILNKIQAIGLGKKLVERLSQLDQLERAKEIVNDIWGPDSPFGTAEVLNTEMGSLLFRYVVEVNPEATANAVHKAFASKTQEELLKVEAGRRNLVWALEKLCFRKETFEKASQVLFLFAVSENESWANNSTNQFRHLFQIALPGTEASLMERLEIIRWALNFNKEEYLNIAIMAMGAGLANDSFTRDMGAEKQGSSAPLVDYYPKPTEVHEYWKEIILILTDLVISQSPSTSLAKEKIARAIRVLIRDNQIDLIENAIKTIVEHGEKSIWMDAINNLNVTLSYERLSQGTVERIGALVELLTKSDVESQLYMKVTKPAWHSRKRDERDVDGAEEDAIELAKQLVASGADWKSHLSKLLEGEQRKAFAFGKELGQLMANHKENIDLSIAVLEKIDVNSQNPEFIGGYLRGAKNKKLISYSIDRFIQSEKIAPNAFYIARVTDSEYSDIVKLFNLVDNGIVNVTAFKSFQYGRALDDLEIKEVLALATKLTEYKTYGKWTALSLLYMYCHSDEPKWHQCKSFMKDLIVNENFILLKEEIGHEGNHWSETIRRLFRDESDLDFAIVLSQQIVSFCEEARFNFSIDGYVGMVVRILFENFRKEVLPIFMKALSEENFMYLNFEYLFGASDGIANPGQGELFRYEDLYGDLMVWCEKYPKVLPMRLAKMMPLSSSVDGEERWHPFAWILINRFGNDEEFLKRLNSNMHTFGVVGSSVPYFIKQKKLLSQLSNIELPKLKIWVDQMTSETDRRIKLEKLDDESRYLW